MRDPHVIHRINVVVDTGNPSAAATIQEEASRLLSDTIIPQMEVWLDWLPGDRYFRIDRLDLDIGEIEPEHFEAEFTERTLSAFRNKLAEAGIKSTSDSGKLLSSPDVNDENQSMGKGIVRETSSREVKGIEATADDKSRLVLDTFLWYLQRGRLPWWSPSSGQWITEESVRLSLMDKRDEYRSELAQLCVAHPGAASRLVLRYSGDFAIELLTLALSTNAMVTLTELQEWLTGILGAASKGGAISPEQADRIGGYISELLKEKWIPREALVSGQLITRPNEMLIQQEKLRYQGDHTGRFPSGTGEAEIPERSNAFESRYEERLSDHQAKEYLTRKTGSEEGFFTGHSGLILLHPFLSALFEACGLLEGNDLPHPERQLKALFLLNFLATGKEAGLEHDMVLEKYLCNIPLEQPIPASMEIPETMKREADRLLLSVIDHWSRLRNTTPNGLREGFLAREGRLETEKFQHRLTVEQRSHDVLLTWLPWGISVFRLPWMKQPLYVDWTS